MLGIAYDLERPNLAHYQCIHSEVRRLGRDPLVLLGHEIGDEPGLGGLMINSTPCACMTTL